jgi:uncharacterized protein YndB with AHSA1/START domain
MKYLMSKEKTIITVQASINAPKDLVWRKWTSPEDITHWYFASDDWHAPRAENDLRPGGKFLFRMEAKDGSYGFDYEGIYDSVKENEYIEYHLADDRRVKITFKSDRNKTSVIETFDAEAINSLEKQQQGWQSILDNFKKYAEAGV